MSEEGGWMIEVLSSGIGGRHRRYLIAIADRTAALAALHLLLGPDTDVSAATRVAQSALDIARVEPGKIVAV
jgi:hypothetical protein